MSKKSEQFIGWPTTRCYPRTMLEAFPNSVDAAQWWHPPERHIGILEIALWGVGVCFWIGLAYYFANL